MDRALRDVNNECGDKVRVKSTPLRSYFSFAEKVNNTTPFFRNSIDFFS